MRGSRHSTGASLLFGRPPYTGRDLTYRVLHLAPGLIYRSPSLLLAMLNRGTCGCCGGHPLAGVICFLFFQHSVPTGFGFYEWSDMGLISESSSNDRLLNYPSVRFSCSYKRETV